MDGHAKVARPKSRRLYHVWFAYLSNVNNVNCESTKTYIHHSKTTKDSRNSSLLALFRTTSKCSCKKFYLGTEDKLLRVSAVVQNTTGHRSSDSPLHFISYDLLFEYHASLVAGGTTQHSFVQCKNDTNIIYRGQENEITRRIFCKGYEIFIHSLVYDKKQAWGCDLCPKQLDPKCGKFEEDFETIECHVSDGINMGTIENDIKGYTEKDIFEEEKDDSLTVKGIEAKERTYLDKIKHRKIVQVLSKSSMKHSDVQEAILKLKSCRKSRNLELVINLLVMLADQYQGIPESYKLLVAELGKCTPISVLLPSHDQLDYKILQTFLDEQHNIFSEYDVTEKVTNAFPLIIRIIKMILIHEKLTFLPVQVAEILHAFIALKKSYNNLARERAAPRKQPSKPSSEAQVYPYYPAHTLNNIYSADTVVDKSEDDGCNKDYNESSSFTGGITHITCNHSVVKGFTAMKKGESVKMIVSPCVTRLPPRVQAKRRFLLYDNACKARSYAERRYPHKVRNWTFLVDRKHWDNHTSCSQAFCMDEYPALKKINSQISEQTNRSIRKLSVVLAYYGWENYKKVIELFFVARNLKIKNLLV